jgi:hypothetical protein
MEGSCPHCGVPLDLPASGVYQCERCGRRFEVVVGSPKPPPAPAPAAGFSPGVPAYPFVPGAGGFGAPGHFPPAAPAPELNPELHAPCASHPGNAAINVCERCGDFMCRLCMTPVEGRLYCPRCFDLLYTRGSLQFTQRQFTLPGITLALGLSALLTSLCWFACMGWVNVPLAIGGIIVGIRALKEHNLRPDLPNRGLTVAGIALSAVSVLVSLGVVTYFIVSIWRS